MTPTQSTQLSRVAAKHGESGWTIEFTPVHEKERTWLGTINPQWNCDRHLYRAVGPRKRVQLKRGMEVMGSNICSVALVVHDHGGGDRVSVFHRGFQISAFVSELTRYRWPNGDGIWLPIEGEPEIISMEGVE